MAIDPAELAAQLGDLTLEDLKSISAEAADAVEAVQNARALVASRQATATAAAAALADAQATAAAIEAQTPARLLDIANRIVGTP